MKQLNNYILEKFKITNDIKVLDSKFYIVVPIGDICGYCIDKYKSNHYDGTLTYSSKFDWQHVFVFYWEDIIDIFKYFKHNISYDFKLKNFLIYDIKNIDSYSSLKDFLDKVKKGLVQAKNFKYNENYAEELDETID